MSSFETFNQAQPECFGTRRDDFSISAECNACPHYDACLLDGLLDDIDSFSPTDENDERRPEKADTNFGAPPRDVEGLDGNADANTSADPACCVHTDAATEPASTRAPKDASSTGNLARAGYTFVGFKLRDKYARLSNKELEAEQISLCEQTLPRHSSPVPYMDVREHYCAIGIVMNERALRPPRFRAACKGEKWQRGMTWTEEMKAMSNDMKIIELHWLHRVGVRSLVKDYEFRELFTSNEFDFELAIRFVLTKWRAETRTGRILLLADVEQWQLTKLGSAEVNKLWKQVTDEALMTEQRLKSAACRKPLLAGEVQDFKLLWIADKICGGKHQRLIGMVHGWLKGEPPLAPATLSAKLKRMRRWTTT